MNTKNANYLFDLKVLFCSPDSSGAGPSPLPLRQASALGIRDGVLEGDAMMNLVANEHEERELFV
jgi:hypothetical protein